MEVFLPVCFNYDKKADYNCAYDISEDDIQEIIGLSHDFVKTILSLI